MKQRKSLAQICYEVATGEIECSWKDAHPAIKRRHRRAAQAVARAVKRRGQEKNGR